MTSDVRASDLAGRRVQEIRRRRGWTAAQLAQRCADAGAPEITEPVIANIETGRRRDGRRRRDVTIDELLILALALNAPPVLLFVPVGTDDHLAVTSVSSIPSGGALRWVCGEDALPGDVREWRESAAPVVLTRRFYDRFVEVVDAQNSGDDAAYNEALPDLAAASDLLTETGMPLPVGSLPGQWVADMRARRLLRYPDEIPVTEPAGSAD